MKFYSIISRCVSLFVSSSAAFACCLPAARSESPARCRINGSASACDRRNKSERKSRKILRRFTRAIANLNAFSCQIDANTRIGSASGNIDRLVSVHYDVRFERPNRLSFVATSKGMCGIVKCDGAKLTLFSTTLAKHGAFRISDAPAEIGGILSSPEFVFVSGGMQELTLLTHVMTGDFWNVLSDSATSTEYLGREVTDGISCHHIRVKHYSHIWDVWLKCDRNLKIIKVAPDISSLIPSFGRPDTKLTAEVHYTNFEPHPKFSEDDFKFDAPAASIAVDHLFKSREEVNSAALAMVGGLAPSLNLRSARGGIFDLTSYKGRKILVLDFGATWCGPCNLELPVLEELSKTYSQEVAFWPINVRETAEVVLSKLNALHSDLDVGLDTNGDSAQSYKVVGLPQTVIIDMAGVIRDVHFGFNEQYKQSLIDKLGELLMEQRSKR